MKKAKSQRVSFAFLPKFFQDTRLGNAAFLCFGGKTYLHMTYDSASVNALKFGFCIKVVNPPIPCVHPRLVLILVVIKTL